MANKKTFKNKVWDWATYSAHLIGNEGFYTALNELLTNAIDAVRDREVKKISIEIEPRMSITIRDSGCGMTKRALVNALRYADSAKAGPNNVFGTGIKTAFSFFDKREGGSYSIYTRTTEGAFVTKAPFGEKIVVDDVEPGTFPGDSWVSTVIRTGLTCETPSIEEISEKLSLYCVDAIRRGITITLNGNVITPAVPGNIVDMDTDIRFNIEGKKNSEKYISFTTYHLEKGITAWEPNSINQGVYVFVNGRFLAHEGIKLVPRKNGEYRERPALHNHYNPLVTFVFIEDESKEGRLPLNSCKTGADWDSDIGRQYRSVIGNAIKAKYDELLLSREKVKKALTEKFLKSNLSGVAYCPECTIAKSRKLRADGIMFNTASIQDATILNALAGDSITLNDKIVANNCVAGLVEFKKDAKAITATDVGQLIGYVVAFREEYKYTPANNVIVGSSITDEAKTMIADLGAIYNISFDQYQY